MQSNRVGHVVGALTCALSLLACGDDTEEPSGADGGIGEAIEIEGTWMSNFDDEIEVISSDSWESFAEVDIVEYDNDENYAILQNPDDADFDPGLFNRTVWTEIEDDSFYYCTVDFGLESAQAARDSTQSADADDPENEGCGGFAWTRLDRVEQ